MKPVRATRVGAAIGALVALLTLGPASAAVLLLRCCGSVRGATWGAWVLVVLLLLVAVAVAAALGAGLAVLLRRLWRKG